MLAGAAGRARAGVRWVKGPYLQDAAPTAITVMFETREDRTGEVIVTGPDGEHRAAAHDGRHHEVTVDGLHPATRYRYRVVIDGETQAGELTTPPEPGTDAPVSFVVYGDTRSYADAHRRVIERIRAEVPDFVLGTGDMVDHGARDDQWQTFFDIEGPLLRDNVLYPAVGNHDRQGRGRTADNFRELFSLPENSPDPERYYAFTYGQCRFLVLDSNAYSFALTDQSAWLERQLEAARDDRLIRHIFVVMHHPPYSVSLHGGQRDLRERWTPLFERYGVAAVFSGHDHVYERAEAGGVRYFVTGGGGAPLYPRKHHPSPLDVAAVKYFERVNHYLRVHVVGDQIEVTAVRVDGTPIETVTWGEPPRRPPPLIAAAGTPAPPPPGPDRIDPPPATTMAAPPPPPRGKIGWTLAAGGILVLGSLAALWKALRG